MSYVGPSRFPGRREPAPGPRCQYLDHRKPLARRRCSRSGGYPGESTMTTTATRPDAVALAAELLDGVADLAGFLAGADLPPALASRVRASLERMGKELRTLAAHLEHIGPALVSTTAEDA